MAETILADDRQTVERLQCLTLVMRWLHGMPIRQRQRFIAALAECSDELQDVVARMLRIVENGQASPLERQRALTTIADALSLSPIDEGEYGQDPTTSERNAATAFPHLAREVQKVDTQEATFADRLRRLMEAKLVAQQELANRVGCSQAAISQLLNRNCRPQKKTILKLAEALGVQPRDLWPDLEVAEMLDAVASFQQDDYVMTQAEADALRDPSRRNPPKIPARSLPVRRR
jgi:transcriptional regulator with XRE-family HTH domain